LHTRYPCRRYLFTGRMAILPARWLFHRLDGMVAFSAA